MLQDERCSNNFSWDHVGQVQCICYKTGVSDFDLQGHDQRDSYLIDAVGIMKLTKMFVHVFNYFMSDGLYRFIGSKL